MDEQRIQAYVALIQALLNCPNAQEAEILQQHQEFVDVGLLQVMAWYGVQLKEAGQTDAVEFLAQLWAELAVAQFLELPTGEMAENILPRNESEQFTLALLQCVADHQENLQQVYPFFQANLARLNGEFLQVLPQVITRSLDGRSLEEQQCIAETVFKFGTLIQQFPLGDRSLNLELAIAAYQQALQVYARSAIPQDWATTQNNLVGL